MCNFGSKDVMLLKTGKSKFSKKFFLCTLIFVIYLQRLAAGQWELKWQRMLQEARFQGQFAYLFLYVRRAR